MMLHEAIVKQEIPIEAVVPSSLQRSHQTQATTSLLLPTGLTSTTFGGGPMPSCSQNRFFASVPFTKPKISHGSNNVIKKGLVSAAPGPSSSVFPSTAR